MNIGILIAAGLFSLVPILGSILAASIMCWALLVSFRDIFAGNPLVGINLLGRLWVLSDSGSA